MSLFKNVGIGSIVFIQEWIDKNCWGAYEGELKIDDGKLKIKYPVLKNVNLILNLPTYIQIIDEELSIRGTSYIDESILCDYIKERLYLINDDGERVVYEEQMNEIFKHDNFPNLKKVILIDDGIIYTLNRSGDNWTVNRKIETVDVGYSFLNPTTTY